MEKDLNESMRKKDIKVANHAFQIIKHPRYQPYSKNLLSWFDIRVFYVRVNNFMVDGYTPEYLTLNHIPLDPDTILEVNDKRCTLKSDGISCHLKRNRVDKKFEEATFVSTNSIRLSGSVKFEVFDGQDIILSGVLELSNKKDNDFGKWSMNCESMICGKQTVVCDSMLPMIEVYVAGSFSGMPVILTETLQIRKGMLDSIPEYETTEYQPDFKVSRYRGYSYKPGNEENYESGLYWNQTEYIEGEDGAALSWFNAGVRVGVGIGLGVCLGVGVGVGLLVRTYQSVTRNFTRRV